LDKRSDWGNQMADNDNAREQVLAFEAALLAMDRVAAERLLAEAGGTVGGPERLERLMMPALERIGRNWEAGTVSLSQVYMSSRICEDLMQAVLPPTAPGRLRHPPLAIAVLEDTHALGKRIVQASLHAAGYALTDYGQGVTAEELAGNAARDGIRILLVSVLMLRSALRVARLAECLRAAGGGIRLVVGGAPFLLEPALWREVGADAMGRNAAEALEMIRTITAATAGGVP